MFYGRTRRRISSQKSQDYQPVNRTISREESPITEEKKTARKRDYLEYQNVERRAIKRAGILHHVYRFFKYYILKVISFISFVHSSGNLSVNEVNYDKEEGYIVAGYDAGKILFRKYTRLVEYLCDQHGLLFEVMMWLPLIFMSIYICIVEGCWSAGRFVGFWGSL